MKNVSYPRSETKLISFSHSFNMSEGWNILGKKLLDAVDLESIGILKEIISKSSRNPQVLDWNSEQVDCVFDMQT